MSLSDSIEHPVLGTIVVVKSARARRFTFRPEGNGLRVVAPAFSTRQELLNSVEEMLPRLEKLLLRYREKKSSQFIAPGFCIQAESFEARVEEGDVRRPAARLVGNKLMITCPHSANYVDDKLQQWFVTVIEESLRHVAKKMLPPRLDELSKKSGLVFKNVAIHKTRGRWGSCSSTKNINLSLFLILLPVQLQDYVMLHELCHTVEMNHGPRFWAKLDSLTSGQSDFLRKWIRKFDTNVFTLQKVK